MYRNANMWKTMSVLTMDYNQYLTRHHLNVNRHHYKQVQHRYLSIKNTKYLIVLFSTILNRQIFAQMFASCRFNL